MVDPSDEGLEIDEVSDQTETPVMESFNGTNIKTCVDCGTSKTPLWRGGPAGPKSLCNACGIKSRKKRRALMGALKDDKKSKKPSPNSRNPENHSSPSCTSSSGDGAGKMNASLKKKLWEFDRDLVLQKPRSSTNQRRKLGEEEQAAILLMALSCSSFYS